MAIKMFCDRDGCEREIPDGEAWFSVTISRQGGEDHHNRERYSTGLGVNSRWYDIGRDDRMICHRCAVEISKVARTAEKETPKKVIQYEAPSGNGEH